MKSDSSQYNNISAHKRQLLAKTMKTQRILYSIPGKLCSKNKWFSNSKKTTQQNSEQIFFFFTSSFSHHSFFLVPLLQSREIQPALQPLPANCCDF